MLCVCQQENDDFYGEQTSKIVSTNLIYDEKNDYWYEKPRIQPIQEEKDAVSKD